MSIKAPLPSSGIAPRMETHHYDMLRPAPYLPRTEMDSVSFDALVDLSAELSAPAGEIIARPFKDHYEILFGYDYLRAYQEALPNGQVLVCLYHYSDSEAVRVALDLSYVHYKLSLIEVAEAYRSALSHFSWRNIDLARALEVKPSTVCNRLKLTELNETVKQMYKDGRLSLEHAKTLSRVPLKDQAHLAKQTIEKEWDTRQLYKHIHPKAGESGFVKDKDLLRLEQQLGVAICCSVKLDINKANKYKGAIKVPFFSISELAGFVERIEKRTKEELRWKGELHLTIDGLDHLDGVLTDLYPHDMF